MNPRGPRYEYSGRLSDSEVLALALLLRCGGRPSDFLVERFFTHLFRCTIGLCYSSGKRRVLRKPRRFFEPLRRAFPPDLMCPP